MIHFLLPAGREWAIRNYLSDRRSSVADRFRVLAYEDLVSRTSFDRGTYVLGGLQLPTDLQRLVEELHRRLSAAGGTRFLNHPTRTLGRYDLLEELRRRNLNEFRAARLTTGDVAALRYPIFLRSEPDHSGSLSRLLCSPSELDGAIGRALWLGYRMDDLLAVEFCDTADEKGYYRKFGAYIVGDRILAMSMEYGRSWMLKHAQTEFSEAMILEEREYILGNPHERELREIFGVAGVQYGRVDYALKDGRIQTWEMDLLPTIGRGPGRRRSRVPPELEPLREVGREHFYRGFAAAWEAVDLPSDGPPPVPFTFEASATRTTRPRLVRRGRLLRALRLALRPFRPILEPLSRAVFPLLARFARRGRR